MGLMLTDAMKQRQQTGKISILDIFGGMAIIGNLFLIIATLAFFGLCSPSFSKAPPGGDAGVGYAWGILLLNLVFFISLIIVALIIGAKGGFDWVSEKKSNRLFIVTIGLLGALVTSTLSSLFRHEAGPIPMLFNFYSSFAQYLIPVVLIGAGFILLNSGIRSSVPLAIFKWPLIIVSAIGVTGMVSALGSYISYTSANQKATIENIRNREDSNHQRMLQEIDSCDIMKNIVFILVMTGDNQDPEIRNRAVAKVKTHPQWQQELIRFLQSDWAPEPFQFLASNDVDDPSIFLEPVRIGVLTQAKLIRESIRNANHPSNYYEGQFSWEVERVLRTVDRFKDKGVDYVPAVKELRAALDEPSGYEKPKWNCISTLDKWIKANA